MITSPAEKVENVLTVLHFRCFALASVTMKMVGRVNVAPLLHPRLTRS